MDTDELVREKQEAVQTKACPLCGETILVVARKCKHCQTMLDEAGLKNNERGSSAVVAAVQQAGIIAAPKPVQTVEQTSKPWKLFIVIGILSASIGGGMMMFDQGAAGPAWLTFGLITVVVAKFCAWWANG